ncbi:MAG: hypothetical protein LBR09_00740 [Endomicrobium sp.]|jgi:hypothetical protein|nr:hypothetical protein [Endomicrobium sp.]
MTKRFLALLFIISLVAGCNPKALLEKRVAKIEENLIKAVEKRIDEKLKPITDKLNGTGSRNGTRSKNGSTVS